MFKFKLFIVIILIGLMLMLILILIKNNYFRIIPNHYSKLINISKPPTGSVQSTGNAFDLKFDDELILSFNNLYNIYNFKFNVFSVTSQNEILCSNFNLNVKNKDSLILNFKISDIISEEKNCKFENDKRIYFRGEIVFEKFISKNDEFIFKLLNKFIKFDFNLIDSFNKKSNSFEIYFETNGKKFIKEKNNLVILPISNYFNYFSNIIYKLNSTFDHASILNNYLDKNREEEIFYINFPNNVPIHISLKNYYPNFNNNIRTVLRNIEKLHLEYDLIYDYNINFDDLKKYNNIIPCGIKNRGITNLYNIKNQNYKSLSDKIIKNFLKNLKI